MYQAGGAREWLRAGSRLGLPADPMRQGERLHFNEANT